MVNKECLEESTKKEILDLIGGYIVCTKLRTGGTIGREIGKDTRPVLRKLKSQICGIEILKKDIEDIPVCSLD